MNAGSGLLATAPPTEPRIGPGGPAGPAPQGPAGPRPARPDAQRGSARSAPVTDADLAAMVKAFLLLYLEVEAGRRGRRQLEPLVHPRLAATLAAVWVRPGAGGQLHQMSGSRTATDRFEAVAVVRRGDGYGAIAVALQRFRRRWRVIDAARPEDGRLPGPAFWVGRGEEWDDQADAFAAVGPPAPIG